MIKVDIPLPQLLDSGMNEITRLHPSRAGYDLNEVPLSTASLILDKETVEQGQFVRMFDTYGSIGVFRVASVKNRFEKGKNQQLVSLEHGFCTLFDTLMTGYREFGGTGVHTATVLAQMLALQRAPYWTLGSCAFSEQYMYSTEYEQLLSGILSVASPIMAPNHWAFNMEVFPWELSLLTQETTPSLELRMNRNIDGIAHTISRDMLCTRLYPLGYGEGVNQLTIAAVNGGVSYIEKNTGIYGVIENVFVDTSITDAQTLMDTAQAYLDVYSEPSVMTEVSALDVFLQTGETYDTPRLGALARTPIAELGISLQERVVRVVKNDIYNQPHKVKIVLTNQLRDSARSIAAILRKSRIGELYSQGSTSFVSIHYADNADASNPMVCDFYLSEQEHDINQVLCKFKLEAFRAYSKAASAGGGSTQTSESGGDGTSGTLGTQQTNNTPLMTSDQNTGSSGSNSATTGQSSATYTGDSYGDGYHNHSIGHTHPGGAHSHTIWHTHEIANHNHTIPSHSHTLPAHTHSVSVPSHTHGITYGIYRGDTAGSVSIEVDGNIVSGGVIVDAQFNSVPYLAKDSDGRITRNTWHTITFTPDSMTRLVVDIQKQTFLRALTGGNY